ncbi:hypothetical protein CH92_17440 [Stutzerimonas stutzeri]|uniref:Uncharacterized protein n=1 Tax=Stutzerimonas stutzeri TaxID=316 RepID=W8R4U6_STUST|nr:hypothetical protein [Stutzerimonas stutzeri]AHL77674.1 hypothetical protein CH92_17440 [Stutzerimonas stutzeri]MCQ4331681.1 hypothetical protein [Stutzerimonas stutzeri]
MVRSIPEQFRTVDLNRGRTHRYPPVTLHRGWQQLAVHQASRRLDTRVGAFIGTLPALGGMYEMRAYISPWLAPIVGILVSAAGYLLHAGRRMATSSRALSGPEA